MKAITQASLLALLEGIKGATFATIVAATDAKLKKTGNPFGPVRKVSRVNVCLGFQYEKAVNRQREREGSETDFEAKPRQWGTKISPMLVEHKGRFYVETKIERSLDHKYLDANDTELSSEQVAPFLPVRSANARQDTEKEILVRDYALDSLVSVAIGGEEYVLV